jgi:hypothetical protein
MGVTGIPYYNQCPMGNATDLMNGIIQGLNRNYAVFGGVDGPDFCTLATLKFWLANNGSPKFIYQVDTAITGDAANPVAILWQGDGVVVGGDPLYSFIFSLGIVIPPLNTLTDPSVPPLPVGPGGIESDYIPIIFV